MGAKERILTLRLLEKLSEHPQWGRELGIEAEVYRESRVSEETEKQRHERSKLWNL